MRSYEAARRTFNKLETVARIISAVGTLIAIGGGLAGFALMSNSMPGPLAMAIGAVPGLMVAMYGSSSLASAQMGRASVDCAEYAQLSLSVSRQQLELAQEALSFNKNQSQSSYAARLAEAAVDAALDASESSTNTDVPAGPSYADRTSLEDHETAPATVPSQAEPAVTSSADDQPETALPHEVSVIDVIPESDATEHAELDLIPVPEAQEETLPQLPDKAVESESLLGVEELEDLSANSSVSDPDAPEDEDLAASADAALEMPPVIAEAEAEEPNEVVAEISPKKEIIEADGVFSYGAMTFSSRAAAERYVSQFGVNANAQLSAAVDQAELDVTVDADVASTKVVYQDGYFVIGGKAFKTKGPALEYQKELLAKGNVS